jgi:hypothetical protein
MEEHDEPMFGGGTKKVQRAVLASGTVKLNGCARFKGRDMPHDIRHGVGLTYGVDADFFAEWLKQNKDSDFVKFVFAQSPKPGEIEAQAKDYRSLKTGLEPIDMNNLPQEFKGKVAPSTSAQ